MTNDQIVCGGLININDKFLMVQESKENISGLWNIPAGRIEENETLSECVRREIKEETNIKARPKGIVGVYFHDNGDEVISIIVYEMEYIDGNIKPNHDDIQKVEILSEEEIKEKELRSNHILQAIEDYKTRQRIPCEYVERIEDIDPSKLARLKKKLSYRRDDITRKHKFGGSIITIILGYVLFIIIREFIED